MTAHWSFQAGTNNPAAGKWTLLLSAEGRDRG